MYQQLKGLNSSEVKDQLAKLGMTPTDVMQRIMADPELAEAFQKPHVQKAIMDSQHNPERMNDYVGDPDVMLVSHQPPSRGFRERERSPLQVPTVHRQHTPAT